MLIFIKTPTGQTLSLEVETEEDCYDIKTKIQQLEGIPIDEQKLIYAGKQLEESRTMKYYGIQKGSSFQLVIRTRDSSTLSIS